MLIELELSASTPGHGSSSLNAAMQHPCNAHATKSCQHAL
jgi:hypothetical protein